MRRAAVLLVLGTLAGALVGACSTNPRSRTGVDTGPVVPGTDAGPGLLDAGPVEWPDLGPIPDGGPRDTDNDGLPDDDELARGTDPTLADTDGDGISDGVEVLAMTDPLDAGSTIPPTDFYVVLPFGDPAVHAPLDFRARLGRADVYFLVDTTASMGLAINNVRTSLATVIVPGVSDAIVDVAMGVGDFRDFPDTTHGDAGDWPYLSRQPITTDMSAVQTALNRLMAGGGADEPESSTEALWESVAGTCSTGSGFGQACFRAMSHPIVVHVTDADFHNGPSGTCDMAPCDYGGMGRTYAETVAAMNAQSVKVVGVAVASVPFLPMPWSRNDLAALCTDTTSRSAISALTVYTAAGGNVSSSVVNGIVDLAGNATQDVSARALDDTTDAVDATQFIRAITPVSATRATRFDATTFYGVAGGTTVTFDVEFANDTQPEQGHPQLYRAYIEVFDVATGIALDRRTVYVVIPATGGILI